MLLNGVGILMTSILIFALGVVCGARLVYRFRHVTTKPLHQSLLNSLQLQSEMLNRDNDCFADNSTVFIDLEDNRKSLPARWSYGVVVRRGEFVKMTSTISENQQKDETWN